MVMPECRASLSLSPYEILNIHSHTFWVKRMITQMCQLVLKVNTHFCVCFHSFFAVDASFSLEQCFAALCFCVFLLALSIQQTLAYSVGLIKAPLCVHSREVAISPTGKSDDDKVQCLANTTGRMKHKDGLLCDTMVTRASVLKSMIRDAKFTDGSGRNIVCTQVELKGLSQLLGIVCLLRSGSGEANSGPVEGGKSC